MISEGDYVRIVGIHGVDAWHGQAQVFIGFFGVCKQLKPSKTKGYAGEIAMITGPKAEYIPYFIAVELEPVDILEVYAYEFNR
jgi:hypothetical protein